MKIQIIETPKGEEMVVLPRAHFERLRDLAEDRLDAEAAKAVRHRIESGQEEVVPGDIADRLLSGENPIKVWREYRGMTQAQLAEKAKLNPAYLWQIENGLRQGSIRTLGAIAAALRMDRQFVGLLSDGPRSPRNPR